MRKGNVYELKVPLMNEQLGSRGIVFSTYRGGCRIIFESGVQISFCREEIKELLKRVTRVVELKNYKFINLWHLAQDYKNNIFEKAFQK